MTRPISRRRARCWVPYATVVPPSDRACCHRGRSLPGIGDDQAREKVDARSTWSSVGATPV